MKWLYKRFIPIGTEEIMDRFEALCERKNLSKIDLILILSAIQLNPSISVDDELKHAVSCGDI